MVARGWCSAFSQARRRPNGAASRLRIQRRIMVPLAFGDSRRSRDKQPARTPMAGASHLERATSGGLAAHHGSLARGDECRIGCSDGRRQGRVCCGRRGSANAGPAEHRSRRARTLHRRTNRRVVSGRCRPIEFVPSAVCLHRQYLSQPHGLHDSGKSVDRSLGRDNGLAIARFFGAICRPGCDDGGSR